jgi:tetrahydromethanopterin:alpha-L-glutamate ligase
MSARICILGSPDGVYVRKLRQAAEQHPAVSHVDCRQFGELKVAIPPDNRSRSEAEGFDAFIVRTMPLGSLEQVIFRMDCLQVFQDRGAVIVNSPKSLEMAIDKWLTLHRLHMAGIPVPATIACQNREAALEAFEQLGGDTVVKPLFGGEGRGILRVQDKDMAWRVFSTLQQLGSVHYVQQFHEHFGYDIRVLFVGNQFFVIRRSCDKDSWRANLSLGARAERQTLSDQDLQLARVSAGVIGGSVVGVDLLPCKDGVTRVLEVNAVPGWIGVERTLGIDISKTVISHVCELVGT